MRDFTIGRKVFIYTQENLILVLKLVLKMDFIILYKLLTVPVVILITTFLVKKFGAFVGGIFAGLPIFSGPISFFITLEQGPDFALVASYNSLIGLIGCTTTALIYAWLANFGCKWWFALPSSVAGYFFVGYFFHYLPQFSPAVIGLACCSFFIATLLLPHPKLDNYTTTRPPWIIWVQLLFGSFMVYSVTEAATLLGPQWSGNMSCFPIMIVVIAPFTHIANGVYTTIAVLRGFTAGWLGTAVFACTVMLTVLQYHISFVYILAAALSCVSTVLYSLLLVHVRKKKR